MATNNFALEVKNILGLENTHLESQVAKIGLNGPMNNRVKVKNIFWVYSWQLATLLLRSMPY